MNTIERVKELGTERNLTLFKLSVVCDVPYTTLKNVEIRNNQLLVDTIESVCQGLGISMAYFFQDWDSK